MARTIKVRRNGKEVRKDVPTNGNLEMVHAGLSRKGTYNVYKPVAKSDIVGSLYFPADEEVPDEMIITFVD